jgi:predicted metal-dependent hydrolase
MIKKLTKTSLTINETPVLVKIYDEPRKNARASMTKNGAILRLPIGLAAAKRKELLQWFEEWLATQLSDEKRKQVLIGRTYNHGDSLEIYNRTYQIHLEYQNRQSHTGNLKDKTIMLKLSENDSEAHRQKVIRQLISRVVAQDCMAEFEKKVDYWNDKYFQEAINTIRLKNSQSNWGSCSSKKNLNFSTRLLFANEVAIDYVIVHELAHLKELNHSPKFWKIVADVMPNYQEQEEWLKVNGHLCQF